MNKISLKRAATTALALSLGMGLSACMSGSEPANRSLNSVNQPVVERQSYALDLRATAAGLPVTEQQRLNDWFSSMGVGYGARVAIDDPSGNRAVAEDVAAIAGRYGLLVQPGAPVTAGYVEPGTVRVTITRSVAYVPGCPNWSDKAPDFGKNATSQGFGCAVNSNMAAMVADPEHLIRGADGNGNTVIMSSNKAIETYRDQQPTGAGGLPAVSSKGE
ncbi:CpaD family pilus assembly protein [Paraurantiacibacter namhicola]|uniref:Pilus biogenesis CpaD protein n=1 Tax=Paraurantiacibacter namhicola TaxID=645517 RepID=A0A1C7DAT0_9SPHN|nr:CpaD family pilus assembly protein [Paraurantiacibacter namhicola]ANU08600.1 Pilus biogenesis CpaD protein [Paraurantiacibacter namhicola]